jgi:selenocysteine lyase/cysteine desulfurase
LLERLEPPMIDHFGAPWVTPDTYRLRDDARRFETWENNYAARLGLGFAVDYAQSLGLEAIEARCGALASQLRKGLLQTPGTTLYDLGRHPAAIVSFTLDRVEADQIKSLCSAAGVNVSTSRPSSTLLDATARHLPTLVRASPHYYNTEEEIVRLLAVLQTIAR